MNFYLHTHTHTFVGSLLFWCLKASSLTADFSSAGETHENMLERHIVEREDGSGNMFDMQQAGNPPVLMFAGVTAIIILIIVVPAFLLFVLLLKTIRSKKLAVPPNQEATGLKC